MCLVVDRFYRVPYYWYPVDEVKDEIKDSLKSAFNTKSLKSQWAIIRLKKVTLFLKKRNIFPRKLTKLKK